MLKGIDPILGPGLLAILREMGHGDEVAIVDANYPAASAGPLLVRMEGHDATRVLDAILSVMPLDSFVPDPAIRMEVVGAPDRLEPVMREFDEILARYEPDVAMASLERFAFYERVAEAYAIVSTGERRLYGNIILKKGIILPEPT